MNSDAVLHILFEVFPTACCINCFSATWVAIELNWINRLHALVFRLSVFFRLPNLCLGIVCFSRVNFSKHFSAVHSVVIVCAGDVHLLFKVLLKFRSVLKHTKGEVPLFVIKISKTSPQRWGFCFETKRNDINRSLTKTSIHTTLKLHPLKNWAVPCLKMNSEGLLS